MIFLSTYRRSEDVGKLQKPLPKSQGISDAPPCEKLIGVTSLDRKESTGITIRHDCDSSKSGRSGKKKDFLNF